MSFSTIGVYDREQPKTANDFPLTDPNIRPQPNKRNPAHSRHTPPRTTAAVPLPTPAPPTLRRPTRPLNTTTSPYRPDARDRNGP